MTTAIKRISLSQITLTRLIIFLILTFVILYGFLALFLVKFTAESNSFQSQISSIQSELGNLEISYIEKSANLSEGLASRMGLVTKDENEIKFVVLEKSVGLSFNER